MSVATLHAGIPTSWELPALEELIVAAIAGDWGEDPDLSDLDYEAALCIRASELRDWKAARGSTAALRKVKKSRLIGRQLGLNDLLVEISGGGPDQPVGRTVIIDLASLSHKSDTPKVCSNFMRRVRLSADVSAHFVNYYLQFFYKTGEIVQFQGGSNNLRNLKFGQFIGSRIPLPPFAEQLRIVAKIEQLFSELDQGIENVKQARAQLAVYRRALLKHAFEGKLTAEWRAIHGAQLESAEQLLARISTAREARYQQQLADWKKASAEWQKTDKGPKPQPPMEPKPLTPLPRSSQASESAYGWLEVAVGDILIGKPTNGRSVKDRPGGFKVLRLTSLKDGTIDLSANKEGAWDESEAYPYVLKRGDFLISRGNGSLRLVGRGGVVKDNLPIAYPDTMVRLVVDPLAFDFRLFCILWNSEVFRQQIERSARTTAGIYKINQSLISNFRFPLVPRPEQTALLEILEGQLAEISRLEADIDTNLQKAETLRQSILKRAFAGELVSRDPAAEPAKAQLARIRAERVALALVPKPKRARLVKV